MKKPIGLLKVVTAATVLLSSVLMWQASPASAAVVDSVPDQARCTSPGGSAGQLWGTGGLTSINRPVIASMTINGEGVPFGEITSPADNKIGVAICTPFSNARKVGVNFIHRVGGDFKSDLTGAVTPSGAPFTSGMTISVTLTDLGTNAEFFSYGMVHGNVSSWNTANLGTPSASLTMSMTPVRIPMIDFNDPGANFCTATPPVCSANQSRLDITGANFEMDMNPDGQYNDLTGAYFSLNSAIAGFVTPVGAPGGGRSLQATLSGAHFLSDGTTVNTGSMRAYLPNDVLADLLELDPATLNADDLAIERTDGGDPSAAPFTLTPTAGGALIGLDNITFSTPVYEISNAATAGDGAYEQGYRMYAADGGVFNYGADKSFGSAASLKLAKPIVAGSSTGDRNGYWMSAADGGVFAYGNAKFYGSPANIKLAKPVVGFAPNPDDYAGYWMAAADGGIFSYGSAKFYGSAGSLKLAKPIVGFAPYPTGDGYWMVASDGGVFAYGESKFHGSLGALKLNSPIVGMVPTASGEGYTLVAADGGVFAFGDAKFYGSHASTKLNSPIVGIIASPTDEGYTLVAADGGVFAYGDAKFLGSTGNIKLAKPVVGISR